MGFLEPKRIYENTKVMHEHDMGPRKRRYGFNIALWVFKSQSFGLVRDLNPGPRAPEARIIPLDQRARMVIKFLGNIFVQNFWQFSYRLEESKYS